MTTLAQPVRSRRALARVEPIPLRRLVSVETRKMFDTRSGFWLVAAIAVTAVLATGAVMVFAGDEDLIYSNFVAAIEVPVALILPIIAVLSVTGEWSQRSALTTFTLVPHRSRVIAAKAVATVGLAVVSMIPALLIGALGTIAGSAVNGVDPTWDLSAADLASIVLGNVIGLLVGFLLGVLIRNTPAAIVGYFVYSFVLPTLLSILEESASWFGRARPWVDLCYSQFMLLGGTLEGRQWAQLAVSAAITLVLPRLLGLRMLMRSEVK